MYIWSAPNLGLKCLMLPLAFLYMSFKGDTHAFLLGINVAVEFQGHNFYVYLVLVNIPIVAVPVTVTSAVCEYSSHFTCLAAFDIVSSLK